MKKVSFSQSGDKETYLTNDIEVQYNNLEISVSPALHNIMVHRRQAKKHIAINKYIKLRGKWVN